MSRAAALILFPVVSCCFKRLSHYLCALPFEEERERDEDETQQEVKGQISVPPFSERSDRKHAAAASKCDHKWSTSSRSDERKNYFWLFNVSSECFWKLNGSFIKIISR